MKKKSVDDLHFLFSILPSELWKYILISFNQTEQFKIDVSLTCKYFYDFIQKNCRFLRIKKGENINHVSHFISNCNQITNSGISHLSSLINLNTLILYNCYQITDLGISHLSSLINLNTLDLCNCHQITYSGISHLSSLINLNSLNLSECILITNSG